MTGDPLTTWQDGAAKQAIIDFVNSSESIPVEERVAVFDNDGTLWCEHPMPIQLDFILRRLVAMAESDDALRERQPWKAAHERDHAWFGALMAEHYAGDDTNVRTLAGGILAAFEGISVEDFEQQASEFLHTAPHPTLGRGYIDCAYAPMVELLGYLRANGFSTYIASGGGRDFMRPISDELYGVPRECVIGSSSTLAYASGAAGGTITHQPEADYLDDGPAKSRSESGAEPVGAHASPPGTRTATSRCSSSPTTPRRRRSACSSSTTTRSGSSRTRPGPRRLWSRPRTPAGRWSA